MSKFLFIANFDKQKAFAMLEREADRQLEVALDSKPANQRQCMRGCGRYVMAIPEPMPVREPGRMYHPDWKKQTKANLGYRIPLFCSECSAEWARLGRGSAEFKPEPGKTVH